MQYAITLGFIAIDIISGLIKAVKNKSLNSSVMREGLWHKASYIIVITLAIMCDVGQSYLNLGYTLPVAKGVCIYVIATEIGSIIENLSSINPKLVNGKLKAFFIKAK